MSPSNETMLTTPVHFSTGSAFGGIEAGEAVAGEQRPVDLLLAILPPAPAGNRRQKGVEALAFDLLADDLLVPGAVQIANHCRASCMSRDSLAGAAGCG